MEFQSTHKDDFLRLIDNETSQKKIKRQQIKFSVWKYEVQKLILKSIKYFTQMNVKNIESIAMMILSFKAMFLLKKLSNV